MKAPTIDESSGVKLPSALAIGFGDQIPVPDDSKARSLLTGLLREWIQKAEGTVYGVCSLTQGGELPFAEACFELGLALQMLLPVPKDELCAEFDAPLRARAHRVLEAAISIDIVAGSGSREDGNYDCGIETVQRSDLLVAFRDGELSGPQQADSIAIFAQKTRKPVVWVDRGQGTWESPGHTTEHALLHDSELSFLNSLPDCRVTKSDDSPTATALQWFKKIDANASRFAPQVRRGARIPILYTAAASVLSGTATKSSVGIASIAISAALGILGAVLPWALRLTPRQALWARTRTATEVCRSEMATWDAPFQCEVIGPEIGSDLAATLTALRYLKMQALTRGHVPLDEFKIRYRKERVRDQIDYYARNALKAEREKKLYRRVKLFSAIGAVALALAWLAGLRTMLPGSSFGLALSALFQGATVVAALEIVNDSSRRQLRYKELHDWLTDWDRQLDALHTWPSVLKVVSQVEKALMVELLEWRSLARNSKMPTR
jgi:hypothetical protein